MTRRYSNRRRRDWLVTRAPRKGTLIVASALYVVGLFGVLDLFHIPQTYAIAALAVAGGLLILGSLLREL
jgi:hypothetical protein